MKNVNFQNVYKSLAAGPSNLPKICTKCGPYMRRLNSIVYELISPKIFDNDYIFSYDPNKYYYSFSSCMRDLNFCDGGVNVKLWLYLIGKDNILYINFINSD